MVRTKTGPRAVAVSDKAIIRSSVALRAPPKGITPSIHSIGILTISGLPTVGTVVPAACLPVNHVADHAPCAVRPPGEGASIPLFLAPLRGRTTCRES